MNNITLAYDDNLGLPDDFAATINCNISAYHQLDKMIDAYEKDEVYGMFIPAGTLPYLKNYEIISQALFENNTKLQTNFITTKNITIADIQKNILGRVNQYCTTSFWSPLIYLMQYLPKNTVLNFKNTNGFQDLLHQTAEEKIDCSMMWNIIMEQNPQDCAKVHSLFDKNDLPTPVLVIKKEKNNDIKHKINQFITQDKKAFFNGFCDPQLHSIEQFVSEMKLVQEYFRIVTV